MQHVTESDLIALIQRDAIKAADRLRQTFVDPAPIDWTETEAAARKLIVGDVGGLVAGEPGLYWALADGVRRAIVKWKLLHSEMPPRHMDVWISYDSRLCAHDWNGVLRVVNRNPEGAFPTYLWDSNDNDGTPRHEPGPVGLWFNILSAPELQHLNPPTMHKYLSEYRPHTQKEQERVALTAVTFFWPGAACDPDAEDAERGQRERENAEMRVLGRSAFDDHRYVNLDSPDGLVQVVDRMLRSYRTDIAPGRFPWPANWPPWFATFLRNVLMRTRVERQDVATRAPLEGVLPEEVVDVVRDIAAREQTKYRTGRKGDPLREHFYRSVTNVRIVVPDTSADLGSVLVFCDAVLSPTLSKLIATAIWPVFSFARDIEDSVIATGQMLRHAHRSAVAALMARNLSHNIGSHVLVRIGNPETLMKILYQPGFLAEWDEVSPDETFHISDGRAMRAGAETVARFSAFLQSRMDFIADIATGEQPPFPVNVPFYSDCLQPLFDQPILWDTLCASHGLRKEDFVFQVAVGGWMARRTAALDKPEYLPAGAERTAEERISGLWVGMPNGAVGAQALYCIVENIVRNTAKHSSPGHRGPLGLRILVETDISTDTADVFADPLTVHDVVAITVSDNWGKLREAPGIIDSINEELRDPLITRAGQLQTKSRGLKEMKAAAAYLRGLEPAAVRSELRPALIRAVDVDGNLGYRFFLHKERGVAIVGGPELTPQQVGHLRGQGIAAGMRALSANGVERQCEMLVLCSSDRATLSLIENSRTNFPIRVVALADGAYQARYGSFISQPRITAEMHALVSDLSRAIEMSDGPAVSHHAWHLWLELMEMAPMSKLRIDPDDQDGGRAFAQKWGLTWEGSDSGQLVYLPALRRSKSGRPGPLLRKLSGRRSDSVHCRPSSRERPSPRDHEGAADRGSVAAHPSR